MIGRVRSLLAERGVGVDEIAAVVHEMYASQLPNLRQETCLASVEAVLGKRETQYAIFTGIALDVLAEEGKLPEPLGSAIARDEPLYGIDEILALSITNIYGSVGLMGFGFLDKRKFGVIGRLNECVPGRVHTFLDDLVAAVAAAAGARLVHQSS